LNKIIKIIDQEKKSPFMNKETVCHYKDSIKIQQKDKRVPDLFYNDDFEHQ